MLKWLTNKLPGISDIFQRDSMLHAILLTIFCKQRNSYFGMPKFPDLNIVENIID